MKIYDLKHEEKTPTDGIKERFFSGAKSLIGEAKERIEDRGPIVRREIVKGTKQLFSGGKRRRPRARAAKPKVVYIERGRRVRPPTVRQRRRTMAEDYFGFPNLKDEDFFGFGLKKRRRR
jgi:hypothetical protein